MEDVIKMVRRGFLSGAVVKNSPANSRNARDMGLIPGLGRSSGIGNGKPLQYSCLENSLDRGAWWATVHGVTKNWTQLSPYTLCSSFCVSGSGLGGIFLGSLWNVIKQTSSFLQLPGILPLSLPYKTPQTWHIVGIQ